MTGNDFTFEPEVAERKRLGSGSAASGSSKLVADWFEAHVDAHGKLAFAKASEKFTASSFSGTSCGSPNNQSAVFDYDGDGEAARAGSR